MNKFAYELAPGDELEIRPRDWVTVASVDRCENRWVSNGVVFFTATNGSRYGVGRNSFFWIRA